MSKHKAFKLNEFTAHTGRVEALRIGRKSGRVLVTGGEDKKVNVWAIGKPNALMSLAGHTSAVESVAFDAGEEIIVAGSAGGTVKMWDLEAKKVIRTLNGHKANCVTVDFHPYGEFFASGSIDTQLKIWDIRRKGCIQTYKGHTKGVRLVRFSPDGRWVVSGGEDGAIKIWDLTAGKLLHDFQERPAAVVAIDFHPHEFLLASGSADGVVKFWDLETFDEISHAAPDSSTHGGVGSITFTPSGLSLLASYRSSLCVWGWEPASVCLDTVAADWGEVLDMTIVNDQLIACTGRDDQVGTWMVNVQKLALNPTHTAPHKPKTHRPETSNQPDFRSNSIRNAIKAGDSGLSAQLRALDFPTTDDADPESSDDKTAFTPVSAPSVPTPTPTSAPTHAQPSKPKPPKQTASRPPPSSTPTPDKGFGIDITPFTQKASQYDIGDVQEATVMAHVSEYHNSIAACLGSRLAHFKAAKTSWIENGSGTDNKGILAVVGTVGELEDAAITVEVLRMLPHREDYLTLDLCTALLPLMIDLLNFTHEDYLIQALAWTSRLVKAFGHVIKTTREAPQAKGVDISKEERLEKCQSCHNSLVTIQHLVAPLSRRSGSVGSNAKDLSSLLKIYVSEA